MATAEFKSLTRKHGIKITATFPCSVEDVTLAVGEKVGYSGIKSSARMNSGVVLFLDQVEKVNRVVETGVTVKGCFVAVQPLALPATKVIVSNVPPFITDDFLTRELSRHGKVVSPMRKILSGCKSPLLKHVVSHRRQLYMILNRREELNLRFLVKVDDMAYTIYASSAVMTCFGCGEEGHTVSSCPKPGDPGHTWSGPRGSAGKPASSWQPTAAPRRLRGTSAAVADQEHGVSRGKTPGECVNVMNESVNNSKMGGANREGSECGVNESMGTDVMNGADSSGGAQTEGGEQVEIGGSQEDTQVKVGGNEGENEKIKNKKKEGEQVEAEGLQEGILVEVGGEGKEVSEITNSENKTTEMMITEQMEEEITEFTKPKVAAKRRRKTKNTNEAKNSRTEPKMKMTTDESSDECVSDSSDVPNFNSQTKIYSADKIKTFLQQTKNQQGVKLEDHFPDLGLFYTSAKAHMSQRGESGLTDQEVFRLRKLVLKAKKIMNDDEKNNYGLFM